MIVTGPVSELHRWANMKKASGFSDSHCALAEKFGISRGRIGFFSDPEDLRARARLHGVPKVETDGYSEQTYGVCIQADDIPGGPDVWILLAAPLRVEAHSETYRRLDRQGLDAPLDFIDSKKVGLLYAFLLLHEVAHHVLAHAPDDDSRKKEDEADRWALLQLYPVFREFL